MLTHQTPLKNYKYVHLKPMKFTFYYMINYRKIPCYKKNRGLEN